MSVKDLANATLTELTLANGADIRGETSYAASVALSVRCVLESPKTHQILAIANKLAGVEAVLFVDKSELPGTVIAVKSKVSVTLDGGTSQTYEVMAVNDRVMDDLAHWECYVKVLR